MNPVLTGTLVFACLASAVFLGMRVRAALPEGHLESGDKGCGQGRDGIRFNDGGSGPRAARRLNQGSVRYQEE
jgi:hypothetical protein